MTGDAACLEGIGTPVQPAGPSWSWVYDGRLHYVGRIWAAVSNYGFLGAGRGPSGAFRLIPDPLADRRWLKIDWLPSFEFPPGTQNDYLSTTELDFGCVRGRDTLVSEGEFLSFEKIVELSASRRSPYYDPAAHAEQQYSAVFFDTTVGPGWSEWIDQRPHKPIGLEIHQNTYAWSDRFSAGFIIADWWFKNIGSAPISGGCMGLVIDPSVFSDRNPAAYAQVPDDIVGFLQVVPGIVPNTPDTLNMAWAADNDGDPESNGQFTSYSVRGVIGVRILRSPPGGRLSFNW